MKDLVELAGLIEREITSTRLRDMGLLVETNPTDRVAAIAQVLSSLEPGAYVIGMGPYASTLRKLTTEAVVIGRWRSPLEESKMHFVDVVVNDTICFVPREVSKTHVKIKPARTSTGWAYYAIDQQSTCGTYVNGEKLEPPPSLSKPVEEEFGRELQDGDVISLGTSGVNTFVFTVIEPGSGESE